MADNLISVWREDPASQSLITRPSPKVSQISSRKGYPSSTERGRPADGDDDGSLLSLAPLKNWFGYSVRSVWRHLPVALLAFLVAMLLGGMLMVSTPPSYQTSVTILLRTEGSVTDDGIATTLDQASRQANGVVTRRDGLDRMINELGLDKEDPPAPFFGRLKQRLTDAVFGASSLSERREDLRRDLRTSVAAGPSPFGESIVVMVTWNDPNQAKAIADLAFQIFFEDRKVAEIRPKEDAVSILTSQSDVASALVRARRDALGLSPQADAPQGSDLQTAIGAERDLKAQLQNAELSLKRAQEGLRYRYALLEPAVLPRKPVRSNLGPLATLLMFAVVVATTVCVSIDRRRGRLLELWELDRYNVRLLARLRASAAVAE